MNTIFLVFTPKEATPNQEYVSTDQLAIMQGILSAAGFRVLIEKYCPETTVTRMARQGPALIFNLAYGWSDPHGERQLTQPEVAAELERLEMPMVGSSSDVQALAQDKLLCGQAAERAGIAAPRELTAADVSLPSIAIIKPRFGACHRGVRIVNPQRLGQISAQSELLQEYIEGEEYTVSVLERLGKVITLGAIQVQFEKTPAIMDWDKFRWRLAPAPNSSGALGTAAIKLFSTLRFRDYARFDFRVRNDVPVLLDANSLPNLHPEISLLPMAARFHGISYSQLVIWLVSNALSRTGTNSRTAGAQAASVLR